MVARKSRRYSAEEQARAMARLKDALPKGATVYGIVRHVAPSGMSRRIDFYTIRKNQPVYLTVSIAMVLDLPLTRRGNGLQVRGTGMNMIFAVVSDLSNAMDYNGDAALRHDSL